MDTSITWESTFELTRGKYFAALSDEKVLSNSEKFCLFYNALTDARRVVGGEINVCGTSWIPSCI